MTPRARSDTSRTLRAGLAVFLGSVALKGLLSDSGWLIDVALTIAVVLGPATLLRLRRAPGALDIWPGVILMIPWLTVRFVPHHARLGFLPGSATLHDLSGMITELHRISQHETAPIQSTPEVRLVLCALIGLLAALVDLIAVVGRRGALAGVPLLVIYTVSGAVPRRAVAWPWFVVAAAGFLILLSLDSSDRLRQWGRRLGSGRPGDVADASDVPVVSRSASRVAAVAIAVAVIVPLALPVPSTNLLANAFRSGKGQPGFGAHGGSGGNISPFALLRDQLNRGSPQDIAKVQIRGAGKSIVPFYLRVNVLDQYTADGWVEGSHGTTEPIATSGLQTAPENDNPRSEQFTAQITIEGLSGNAPLFTAADRISGLASGTRWSPQDQLLLSGSVRRGQQIVEVVSQPAPSVAQLAAATSGGPDVSRWLAKPELPAYVTDLVTRLTAEAHGPYARALAISNYFADPASGFSYSTRVPVGDSGSALVDFLQGKRGFCQQFAAAMAIMLRQAGVPSRVVLGYEHRPMDADNEFTVTTNDAHAWVEAYFPGIGWIPFDPTPPAGLSGGPQSDLPWARHAYGAGVPGGAVPSVHKPQPRTSAAPTKSSASAPPIAATTAPSGDTSVPWSGIVVTLAIVLILALALLPAGARELRRRRRLAAARRGNPDALWAELSDTAVDLGYGWSDARSPRQVVAWLTRALGRPDAALDALAAAVERHRFAPARSGDEVASVRALGVGLRQLSKDLRSLRSAGARLSARLWPRSLGWRLGGRDSGRVGSARNRPDGLGAVRQH